MPGRFFLGVGTGENLNEHILGDRWPGHDERARDAGGGGRGDPDALGGRPVSHRGRYYTVDRARLYCCRTSRRRSRSPPAGDAAELAGRIGDALISTAPDAKLVEDFERAGGDGKPRYGQLTVCWAETEEDAIRTALRSGRTLGCRVTSARSCRCHVTSGRRPPRSTANRSPTL